MEVTAGRHHCPQGCMEYVVRPGDTMFLIAQHFGISLDELIAANPQIENPDLIYPDQVICVPRKHHMPPPMDEWCCLVMRPMHPDVCDPGVALLRMMPGHVMVALMGMPKPHHFQHHAKCYVAWVMCANGTVRDCFELAPSRAAGFYVGHKDVSDMMMDDHLMVTAEYGSHMKKPEGEELLGADVRECPMDGRHRRRDP